MEDEITKAVKAAIEAVQDKVVLKEIGEELIRRMQVRTRTGRGVKEPEGKTHALPKLKDSTIKTRKSLKSRGQLTGPGAAPSKSGLNRTGSLLESLHLEISRAKLAIVLDPKEEKKLRDLLAQTIDWQFMNISKVEFAAAVEILEKIIEDKLK